MKSLDFIDATGTLGADCGVSPVDGPYPAMVRVEIDAGSLLADDARRLAEGLIALADEADRQCAEATS